MSTNSCCGPTGCETTQSHTIQAKTSETVYRPRMDVIEFPDRYEISVDVPGSTPEQISAAIEDGVLTIEAGVPNRYENTGRPLAREFGVGDFRRRVRLGEDVDGERVAGDYASGVLTLTLPKRVAPGARVVPIKGA